MKASGYKLVTLVDTKDEKGFRCLVQYDDETISYVVSIFDPEEERSLHEDFKASFRPYFGMDVVDIAQANEIADRLANKLENSL